MWNFPSKVVYGKKLQKGANEYRKVILTQSIFKAIQQGKILEEKEWRALGIEGSLGWEHYKYDPSYPHVMIFRKCHISNPVENLSLSKIINEVVGHTTNQEVIMFRRESDQVVTERTNDGRQVDDVQEGGHKMGDQRCDESFDVPEIKLFGRQSSASSGKTLKSLNNQLETSNLIKRVQKVQGNQNRRPSLKPFGIQFKQKTEQPFHILSERVRSQTPVPVKMQSHAFRAPVVPLEHILMELKRR